MEGIITATARLVRAAQKAYARKWSFLVLFLFVLFVSFVVLGRLDLLPDAPAADAAPAVSLSTSAVIASTTPASTVPELPTKISIPAINLSVNVSNPTTTDDTVLDNALLSGAVRYPTSGELGQDNANVVIFGHSSYLPIVHNQAYKTFDGIQNLHAGDTIVVYSTGAVYTYAVQSVTKESAASDEGIPLQVSGKVLTLSTCDSFGVKTDRFVVVATFVESHPAATS